MGEEAVLAALEDADLHPIDRGRYFVSRCPLHEDRNPSAQVFKDGWVNCLSGCGRFHISKAFPQFADKQPYHFQPQQEPRMTTYQSFDLLPTWHLLPKIPRDHQFKTIPLEILDGLGWRWDEPKNSYFIPYWNRDKTAIPFAQWRHLDGPRRFTFLKDAQPKLYGSWNAWPEEVLFLVEGTSDAATLEYCAVPYIAAPSAASGTLMRELGVWASKNAVRLVYAGDNDEAGDKLRQALDDVTSYRICQPPKRYKDWGDFLVAEGQTAVNDYCVDRELRLHVSN